MNGISNVLLRKPQPVATPGSPASRRPAVGPKPLSLAQTLSRDEVHFEGRRRKTPLNVPPPEESSSDESWKSENGEYSDSDTISTTSDTPSQATVAPEQSRYNLRKRPRTESSAQTNKTSDSEPESPKGSRPGNSNGAGPSGNQPPQKDSEAGLPLGLLLALLGGGKLTEFGGEDSDSDEDKSEFNVISHKKSPFGPNAEKLGFKRIAGMESLKSDLNRLLVDQLKNPQIYKDYGLENSSSGVLLYGPPGNGKTFFAKALAEEANANFLEIHPSTIASPYIHQTSKMIGGAFDAAAEAAKKSKKPTVLLIDEVDAVAPQRGGDVSSNHNNEEVAEFLNQLNECSDKNVFVVATTNLPDRLDPALVRSGRMNAKIYVGAPDQASREQVLKHYLTKRSPSVIDEKLDLSDVARETKGYSIADLQELGNQAARYALEKREKLSNESFTQALKKVHPSVNDSTEAQYKQMIGQFETKPTSEDWKRMYI